MAQTIRRPTAAEPHVFGALKVLDVDAGRGDFLFIPGQCADSEALTGQAIFRSRWAFRSAICVIALCWLATFGMGATALAISLRMFWADVVIGSQAANPDGYLYGGAMSQGSGMWITSKPQLPFPRSDLCAVSIGSAVYLLGGLNDSSVPIADVLVFFPLREVYQTGLAPMPVPRFSFAAAAVNKTIYVVGGKTTKGGNPIASVDAYDTKTDTWKASGTIPPMSLARCDLAAASIAGKLYVVGGMGVGNDMSVTGSLLEVYDPVTRLWQRLPPVPTPRTNLMAVAFAETLWVIGGWWDKDNSRGPGGDFQAAVEAYSPSSGTWRAYANMLTRKGDSVLATYRDQIMTVGGETWSGGTAPCPTNKALTCKVNQLATHDAATFFPYMNSPVRARSVGPGGYVTEEGKNKHEGVWVAHAPMPGPRFRFAGAAIDEGPGFYVFGGTNSDSDVLDNVAAFYDTYHAHVFMHYKESLVEQGPRL